MTKNIAQKADDLFQFVEDCYYTIVHDEKKLNHKAIRKLNDCYNLADSEDYQTYFKNECMDDDLTYMFDEIIANCDYL